jgi:hypothetical protein
LTVENRYLWISSGSLTACACSAAVGLLADNSTNMVVTASVAWGADEPSEMKVFALFESLDAQMQRLKQLETASPATANRIMQRGQLLVSLAKAGNLKQLDSAVTSTAPWEILIWFVMQAFRAATLAGHISVVRIFFPAASMQSASY